MATQNIDADQMLQLAADAALDGLKACQPDRTTVLSQSGKDIKTSTDFGVEERIIRSLQQTNIPIVAEETTDLGFKSSGLQWIVDPLDGTANYVRGFPCYCISIALYSGLTPVIGCIYDIANSDMYLANCQTNHATVNGKPIGVSTKADISQSILTTGFPTKRDFSEIALRNLVGQFQRFKKVRMIGAAAMSLAYVANGTFDVHFEEDTMIWDVAAGLALVKAAGGESKLVPGSGPNQYHVAATNGSIPVNQFLIDQ